MSVKCLHLNGDGMVTGMVGKLPCRLYIFVQCKSVETKSQWAGPDEHLKMQLEAEKCGPDHDGPGTHRHPTSIERYYDKITSTCTSRELWLIKIFFFFQTLFFFTTFTINYILDIQCHPNRNLDRQAPIQLLLA